jgi:hypothetical protein
MVWIFRNDGEQYWLTKKITEWKPVIFRPRGRPKMKWKDNIKQNLKVTAIYRCKKQAKSRNVWKQITEQATDRRR